MLVCLNRLDLGELYTRWMALYGDDKYCSLPFDSR